MGADHSSRSDGADCNPKPSRSAPALRGAAPLRAEAACDPSGPPRPRWQRGGRGRLGPMQRVLVAVDLSPATAPVLRVAEELAGALGAELRLVHVAAPEPEFVGYDVDSPALRDTHAAAYRDEHRRLQELAEGVRQRGGTVKALLIQGPTVEKILEEAERLDAGLLVVGSHGRGALARVLLGSVSEGVLHRSHRPVVVVPSRTGG